MYPQIFGKYVLERPIAVGGMARVFLATLRGASGFEKRLVVKQIRSELATDEAFVKRFVQEAKTTVELSHPNIVPVYELGVEQGVYYLAMELCDGVTLAELLQQEGRLSPEGAYVGVEICRALDYAHRKAHVIHRDVTPRNVILDEEGAIRLIDFGIAARAYSGQKEVFGSPGHMPPEQIMGGELGHTTDVFAVAVLLYEAWSANPPFRRRTPEESERALASSPAPLSSIEPALAPLDAIMASAMAPEPDQRPKTAEELSRALRQFASGKDAGDLARKLGAKVREVRAIRASLPPPKGPEDPEGDAAIRSSVTRTFAATRGLQAATAEVGGGGNAARGVAPEEGTRRISEEAASWSTAKRRVAPHASWRLWTMIGIAGTAGAALLVGVGRSTSPAIAPTGTAAPNHPLAQAGTTAPSAPTAAEVPPVSSTTAAATSAAPDAPSASPARPLAPTAPVTAESAKARILANPEAIIEVDGKARGVAPIEELTLAPGMHRIRMSCPPLGETVSQNVRVEAGDKITIAADFTGSRSRITVRTSP